MKQKFSTKWIGSKQPRKQRKYRANAPLHIKRKFVSANLSKTLKQKYSRKSFPLKKDDKVRVMKGEFRKKTGKISLVDLKKTRVSIEGIQRTKKDGTKINVWFNPSNLQIQELDLEDKKRRMAIERTGKNKPITQKISSKQMNNSSGKSDIEKNKIKEKKQNGTPKKK
jgi:large subunit ribosomal protein L24